MIPTIIDTSNRKTQFLNLNFIGKRTFFRVDFIRKRSFYGGFS